MWVGDACNLLQDFGMSFGAAFSDSTALWDVHQIPPSHPDLIIKQFYPSHFLCINTVQWFFGRQPDPGHLGHPTRVVPVPSIQVIQERHGHGLRHYTQFKGQCSFEALLILRGTI